MGRESGFKSVIMKVPLGSGVERLEEEGAQGVLCTSPGSFVAATIKIERGPFGGQGGWIVGIQPQGFDFNLIPFPEGSPCSQ